MVSYGIISLSKKLTHIYFSRLRSINEYLVFDWGPKRPSPVTWHQPLGPCETLGAHTTAGFTSRCFCECLARLQEFAIAGPEFPE